MELKIAKLHPDAKIPGFAHEGDAGMDLCAIETVTLAPRERAQIGTGIAMEIPEKHVGLIWDKSGLSHKYGIKTLGGVVDAGYRGEIKIGVINMSGEPYTFEAGYKVAQMLIQKIKRPDIVVVDELTESARGDNAFGSTGK
jgi:dUTP pyrophosphatase